MKTSINSSKFYVDLKFNNWPVLKYLLVEKWVYYEEEHRIRAKLHHETVLLAVL